MRRHFTKIIFRWFAMATFLVQGLLGATSMENSTEAFTQANVLFETDRYAEAAAAYEAIERFGKVSPELYFNLGTAHLKADQLGRAIFYLRQAQRITPRDGDTQRNLQFARAKAASGRPLESQLWRDLTNWLTLGEWAALASLALWLWICILTANQLRPGWRDWTRPWLAPLGIAAMLLLPLASSAWLQQTRAEVVVIVKEAVVRFGPLEESQTAHTLTDGAEVRALDEQRGWLRVIDAAGREGWIRVDQIAVLNPGY